MWNNGEDNRFPIRPYALTNVSNNLDIIDIHIYSFGQTMENDLATIEWNKLNRRAKPIVLGEYGAYKSVYSSTVVAAPIMKNQKTEALLKGFKGTLFWIWNDCGLPLYAATEGNSEIKNALKNN
jgi:endo-1,4-beta-mannosidase